MSALELAALFAVAIALTVVVTMLSAPEGWEDDSGFHLGKHDDGASQ